MAQDRTTTWKSMEATSSRVLRRTHRIVLPRGRFISEDEHLNSCRTLHARCFTQLSRGMYRDDEGTERTAPTSIANKTNPEARSLAVKGRGRPTLAERLDS